VDEDDEIIKKSPTFIINIGGVRVNTIENTGYDSSISSPISETEAFQPQEKIVIQGGHFYAQINLFDKINLDDNDQIYQLRTKTICLINEPIGLGS
jgi:hypothetical protein